MRHLTVLLLILTIATSAVHAHQGSTDRTYRWDGHDFVFCFVSDDGCRANLAWADTAMVMDFRFTIAVNVNANNKAGTDRHLSHAEMHALASAGFEIAHHGRTHGEGGLSTSCSVPPRGSLMGYFLCDEPSEEERMLALMVEISRDTLAYHCDLPLSSIRVVAYPRHRHGIALIDTLIAEGFIGARAANKWNPEIFSYGDFTVYARNSWDDGISLFRVPTFTTASHLFGNHSAVPPIHKTYAEFLAVAQPFMDEFRATGGICVLYTHHLGDDDDSYGQHNYGSGGITKRDLAWMVDLVRSNGGTVMTFGNAVAYYRARSHMVNMDGDLVWVPGVTAVENPSRVGLSSLRLYPNPFNPKTVISFALETHESVNISIHDMRGRLVKRLIDMELEAGIHEFHWDGTDRAGLRVHAGTYLVTINTRESKKTKKVSIVK